MKRKILGFLGAAGLLTLAVTASAGYRSTNPVYVSLSGRYAYGSLGSVRASSDVNEYIGCSLNSNGAICCRAADSTAYQVPECCTSNPSTAMQTAVSSLHGDSYLYFTWDANWNCNYIYVENNSMFLPKPQ
jgi:hypothetical protein